MRSLSQGRFKGKVLLVAMEGRGERSELILDRSGEPPLVFEDVFDGRRHDFLFLASETTEPGMLGPNSSGRVRIIDSRLYGDGQEEILRSLDRANAQLITQANWEEVQAQERDHTEWCRGYPAELQLELTKACNYQCPHCMSHGKPDVHSAFNQSPVLEDSLLDRMAEEVFPFLRRISLVGSGEPFMAPKPLMRRLLRHMDQTDTRLEVSTNGTLLSEELSQTIAPLLSHISFSVDAATAETYRKARASEAFHALIEIIRRFQRLRDDAPLSQRFAISLVFTLMRKNASELLDFLEICQDLQADAVYVRHLLVHFPEMKEETLIDKPAEANPILKEAAELAERLGLAVFLPDLIREEKTSPKKATELNAPRRVNCCFLWRAVCINTEGMVMPCGGLHPVVLGKLDELPFKDIWNGELIREMRRRLDTADPHPMCAHCWYRQIAYFDSPTVTETFLQTKVQTPKEKPYDASAFFS